MILWYVKHKRSIVPIHGEDDPFNNCNDCFAQFVIFGLAWLSKQGIIVHSRVFINDRTYKRLISSASRYDYRHSLALSFMKEYDFTCGDRNSIQKIEKILNIHIVLISYVHHFKIEYPSPTTLPYETTKPTIFGLVSYESEGKFDHVDFVSNYASLHTQSMSGQRVCQYCFTHYTRRRNCNNEDCNKSISVRCVYCHNCDGLCTTCRTTVCGKFGTFAEPECQPLPSTVKCDHCFSKYYSMKCLQLHECIQVDVKKCSLCTRTMHRGLLCDEKFCMMCGRKRKVDHSDNHSCFVNRVKWKKYQTKYWSYDVETCLSDSNEHVLYLITCYPIYWLESYDVLLQKYPNEKTGLQTNPVFIFWGLENVYQWFDFLCEPVLKESIFFAHNAAKYDSIFVEKYLIKLKNVYVEKIQRGLKLLEIRVPDLELTFRDSLQFIPTSLRAMSADFGIIDLAKGHFPHKVMTVDLLKQSEKYNYRITPPPGRDMFDLDVSMFASEADRKEVEDYVNWFCAQESWDLKTDAIKYCISDTVLLGQVLQMFSEKCRIMTQGISKEGLDPLQFCTLPGAVMKYYLAYCIPQNQIAVIDRYEALMQIEERLYSLYSRYTNESRVFKRCYDGGCLTCYKSSERNIRYGKKFGELYYQTVQECSNIMWEHEWDQLKTQNAFKDWQKLFAEEIEDELPLDPRDAYKGGISECYKHVMKDTIQMVDFVSQYPTTLIGKSYCPYTQKLMEWNLPTGVPTKLFVHDYKMNEKLAVVKCRVLAPRNLYAPFLGYYVKSLVNGSREVMYGLCRTCMQNRIMNDCTHSDTFRSFVGTWTSVELQHAIVLGYVIEKTIDVWEYQTQSNQLFCDFIKPFLMKKILCKKSGLVENGVFTKKGSEISAYLKSVCNVEVSAEMFSNNPAERTIAKLIMNSFYGKWGQRSLWSEIHQFQVEKDYQKCMKVMYDPNIIIEYGEVLTHNNETYIVLEYEKRLAVTRGDMFKNDHIAAFITAYGRIMLNQLVQALGSNILYTDTDSAFYKRTEIPFQTGFRIGDLELELKEGTSWIGLGRKSYTYLKNNEIICKQKGISLRKSHCYLFSPTRFEKLLNETKQAYDEEQGDHAAKVKKLHMNDKTPTIHAAQVSFDSKRENILWMNKRTRQVMKKTNYLMWSMKRRPLWESRTDQILDTVPFGYNVASARV